MNRANFQAANKPTPRTVETVVADILGIPDENTNDIQYDFKCNGEVIRVRKGGADHADVRLYRRTTLQMTTMQETASPISSNRTRLFIFLTSRLCGMR